MFGFLKEKLKQAVDKFTKKAEDEADVVEEVKKTKEVPVEKPKKEKKKESVEEKKKPEEKVEPVDDVKEEKVDEDTIEGEKEEIIIETKEKSEKVQEPEIVVKDPIEVVEDKVEEKEEDKKEPEETKEESKEAEEEPVKEETDEEEEEEEKPKKKEGFFQKLFKKKEKEPVEEDVEEKTEEEEIEELVKEVEEEKKPEEIKPVKKVETEPVAEEKKEPEPIVEEKPEEIKEVEPIDEVEEETEEKKGFFQKITETITKVSLSEKKFDELFWELEVTLLENNVAVEVIEKIKNDLKEDIVNNKVARKEMDVAVMESLKKSILGLFNVDQIDILKNAKSKKPYVIVFVGVNGAGKTTNLAKLAHLLKKNGLTCVVGACDTFRAAAIQQLEEHADNVGIKIIKHDYGSDPAAVAFDTIKHAESQNVDVVLLDTAGRLHSNKNLMQELEKVIRISKPDLKIFVGESLAGNDVVEQARLFNDAVGVDGIILSKADTDEKGGAAISVTHITGKPILFLGVGQNYEDLEVFDKEKLIEKIGL